MGEKQGEEIFGNGYVLCKSTLFLQGVYMRGGKRWITLEGLENKGNTHVENSVDNVDNNL